MNAILASIVMQDAIEKDQLILQACLETYVQNIITAQSVQLIQ